MSEQAGIGHLLLRSARSAPKLDVVAERELVERYHDGDRAALGQLIIANVRLCIARAHALRGYGLSDEDLIQEGIIGLLEAASRFDIGQDVRFSTYASWWIKATTNDFVLRNWSIVRVSLTAEQKRLFFRLRGMHDRLSRDPSADPAAIRSAIASALGVPERDVDIMEARLTGDISLNAPAFNDEDSDAEIGDNFAADDPALDDAVFSAIEVHDKETALRSSLSQLDETEQLVIRERWLAEDIAPLEAIGEFLGITAQRVKRIEIAALAKLQMGAAQMMRG